MRLFFLRFVCYTDLKPAEIKTPRSLTAAVSASRSCSALFLKKGTIYDGKPLYQIERCFLGTGEKFEDGSHILYVNGAYRDETPIGKLMHDFSCTNPSDMYYGVLADRVRFFKESKEGIAVMCKAMEDMRTQTLKEGLTEVALRMLSAGKYTLDEISAISGLSLDEVKKLSTDKTA